jgi:hypothetical protein
LALWSGHHCPDPPGRCRLPSPIGAEMSFLRPVPMVKRACH